VHQEIFVGIYENYAYVIEFNLRMRKSTLCPNEIRLANNLCDMQRGKASKIELLVYQNRRKTIGSYVAGLDM